MAGNNIGNLESKVVVDVSQALADINSLSIALGNLAAKIEQMSKAQTIGPSIRNLAALEKAAKAMDKLRSAGQPSPAATAAAGGGGNASAEGSLKLTNEDEIGKAIAGSIKSVLEGQTLNLSVNLKIKNLEDIPEGLKGLADNAKDNTTKNESGIPGVSATQKWSLEKGQFRATNELTQALKRAQATSSGATGTAAQIKEGMKSLVDVINSGEFQSEIGPVKIEGSSLADQISDAVGKLLGNAPAVTRAGRVVGKVTPIEELSSFSNMSDDLKEVLGDFRDSVLVPIMFAAKQGRIDENKIYSAIEGGGPVPSAERPPTSEGTRNAYNARIDAAFAAATARRNAVQVPAPSATAAATGELASNPARIVSRASAEDEQRKLDEMIAAGIRNKPESYRDRNQAFERIRGLMEYEGQIEPLNVVGALGGLPYVGATANFKEIAVHDTRREGLVRAIEAINAGEGATDPDTGKPITAISRDHALRSLRTRLNEMGPRPEMRLMDEADVVSELTRMGAGKGFRDAPKAIPALEPLLNLINQGELQDIGYHKESGSYFFPSNDAERFQLRRVGYGHDVTMGDRGSVTRMKPGDFLREYLTQQIKDQVHREGQGSENPLVRRMAGMSDSERELEAKTLVDRLMVGVGGGKSIASEWLASAAERPSGEQGTKFDQQSVGNRGDFEARRNLDLKRVQDEIERINSSGRVGPKRRARLEELTRMQSDLLGQGADTSAFERRPDGPERPAREPAAYSRPQAPGPEREPDFVERLQAQANADSRERVESGFGLDAGVLWDRLDAQQKKVEEALTAEIADKIRTGELLDPNDFVIDALNELTPLQGSEKRDRANELADELSAGLKEYAKSTFGKDDERRRIYMREVNTRMSGLRRSTALPRPGGAAQKPGGYSTVLPRGMNERTDPYLITDLDNADRRTGRGYTERDVRRPLETTIERDKTVLRSKILNEFKDIADRIPLDIAGIKEDTDQARRRGQATRGQTGAGRADFRRSRLGKEVETPGDVPRYVELTPDEEEAKFGGRYRELDSAVQQYRLQEMAQRAARGIIRRSGLDETATLQQRNDFLRDLAGNDAIPSAVKSEVGELLAERNFGHIGEGVVTQSAQQRENYVTGDKLREIYAKGAPLSTGEMVEGTGEPGAAGGGGFAGPGIYKVFVTNWPTSFARAAAGGGNGRGPRKPTEVGSEEPPREPRRERQYGPFPAELKEPQPVAWPKIAMLRDPRGAQVPPQMRIAMRPRVAHTEEERAARALTGRMYGPTLADLMPPQMANPTQPIANAATLAGIGTRIRMMPQERQSAAGRALQGYYDRQEKAESSKGRIDEQVKRLTAPLPEGVVQARVASQLSAQRLQSRSLGTSIVSFFESLNPYRQQAQAARVRLNERTSVLDTLYGGKINAIGNQAASAAELRSVNLERRRLLSSGIPESQMPTSLRERRVAAGKEYVAATYAVRKFTSAITDVEGEVAALSKEAGGLGAVFSTLATGAVGGIVGSAVTMGISAVAETAIKGVALAAGPSVERATGNTATTARIQSGLGQAVAASGGYTSAAVGGQMAQSGISAATAERLSRTLEGRAQGVAAGQQTTAQLDLIRSASRIGAENRGYGKYDKSLFATTGGLFGTPLGGQASVSEQLYDIMKPLSSPDMFHNNGLFDELAHNGGAIDGLYKAISGGDTQYKDATETLKAFESQVNRSTDAVKLNVDAANKGSKANEALAKNAEKFNNRGWAELIRATGMTLNGYKGKDPFAEMMQRYSSNAVKLPASLIASGMEPQLKAQRYSELAQNQLQIGTVIPQQFAMQQTFNPLIGSKYSADSVLRAMTKGTGATLDKGTLSRLFGSVANVQADAVTGRNAAIGFAQSNLPAAEAQEFARNLSDAASKADQIANARIDSQMKQAALSANQYKESLRQAKIAASDARAMANMKPNAAYNESTSAGNLGALQRSDFMLGQQSAVLGQAMSQRQINFKRAMAGFAAPGVTPEQRAANIEYTKYETDYEQKQLNIQKKMTANQAAEFNITSARNVTLTANQVDLMQQSNQTGLDVAADESLIAALTAELQQPMQKVETTYNTALQAQMDKIGAIAGIISQTSDSFAAVKKTMDDMLPSINAWASALGIDTSGKGKGSGGGNAQVPYQGWQTSVVFNINGNNIGTGPDATKAFDDFVKKLGVMATRFGLRAAT